MKSFKNNPAVLHCLLRLRRDWVPFVIFAGVFIMTANAFFKSISLPGEIWKDVVGFEGLYKVSDKARMVSMNFNCTGEAKLMKVKNKKTGYCNFGLYKDGEMSQVLLHRLVAIAFIPNPENKCCVNHKKGVWFGHAVDNLEWATSSENELHSFRVLGKVAYQPMKGKFGKDHNRSKGVTQYSMDGVKIAEYGSSYEALRVTGISQGNIGSCIRGERKMAGGFIWKYTKIISE